MIPWMSILKPVASYGAIAALAWYSGANNNEMKNMRETGSVIEQIVEGYETRIVDYTRIIANNERTQAELEHQRSQLNAQLQTLIDDQTDAVCTTSAGVTGVLLESRYLSTDDATARGTDDPDSCPSPFIGYRDLVSELNNMQVRYNQARTQCNSLIEWIEINYADPKAAGDQ